MIKFKNAPDVTWRHETDPTTRRERIATAVLPTFAVDFDAPDSARRAVAFADALIAELDKGEP